MNGIAQLLDGRVCTIRAACVGQYDVELGDLVVARTKLDRVDAANGFGLGDNCGYLVVVHDDCGRGRASGSECLG